MACLGVLWIGHRTVYKAFTDNVQIAVIANVIWSTKTCFRAISWVIAKARVAQGEVRLSSMNGSTSGFAVFQRLAIMAI